MYDLSGLNKAKAWAEAEMCKAIDDLVRLADLRDDVFNGTLPEPFATAEELAKKREASARAARDLAVHHLRGGQ